MAIPLVTITGHVLAPNGDAVTSGTIELALSTSGSIADGATSERIPGGKFSSAAYKITLDVGGAIPATAKVAPNTGTGSIVPTNTYYTARFSCITAASTTPVIWTEKWQVAASPTTISIGAIPRIDAVTVAGDVTSLAASAASSAASAASSASAASASALSAAAAVNAKAARVGATQDRRIAAGIPVWNRSNSGAGAVLDQLILPEDPNTVAHFYAQGASFGDTKVDVPGGGSWTVNGSLSVTEVVAASKRSIAGIGPFSAGNYLKLGTGSDALDFTGDFTCAIVFTPNGTGTGRMVQNGIDTGEGYSAYVGTTASVRLPDGANMANTANGPDVGSMNVFMFGRAGSKSFARLNAGLTATGTALAVAATTKVMKLGVYDDGNTQPFNGLIHEVLFTKTPPSDAFFSQLYSRARRRLVLTNPLSVVCLGDSITYGLTIPLATPYPVRLATLLGVGYSAVNAGEAGDNTGAMRQRWDGTGTSPDVNQALSSSGHGWLALLGGINDLNTSMPTSDTEAHLEYMWRDALDAGMRVVAMTIMPFGSAASWTSAKQTKLENTNAWIRQRGSELGIAVVDLYELMRTGTALKAEYDSGDGLHESQAGADYIAAQVAAAITG